MVIVLLLLIKWGLPNGLSSLIWCVCEREGERECWAYVLRKWEGLAFASANLFFFYVCMEWAGGTLAQTSEHQPPLRSNWVQLASQSLRALYTELVLHSYRIELKCNFLQESDLWPSHILQERNRKRAQWRAFGRHHYLGLLMKRWGCGLDCVSSKFTHWSPDLQCDCI